MRQILGNLTALLVIAAGALMAQPGDPPSRVARVNYLNGPVSFRPGSVEDWGAASLNYPLTTGDHLWTDAGARAEMHVGSTAIRMDSRTALAILNLDDRVVQLSLTSGSLNIRIRAPRPDEVFEVDTPNASIVLQPGDYRISIDDDRPLTLVTTRQGEASIAGGGSTFPVYGRQMARISGTDTLSQEIIPVPAPDNFDGWCGERERREESMVSARYVPRDIIGYEDLDAYGAWRNVAPYGWVWAPSTVSVGWAPYHNGRWAWVEPWGWTWIDEAPWGFAPFHYGRWANAGGTWLWVPGRMDVAVRPVYAPALVAFVGGPRFGLSISVGGGGGGGMAAWFPLGPGEVYRPAYHVSDRYVRQINVVHVTNVTVINQVNVVNVRYANQAVPGAVTAVPHDAFVSARAVQNVSVRVDAREVAQAPVMGSTAAVAPRRESVLAGRIQTNVPPARFAERQVVSKSAPPPPPVSFATKQKALEGNGGRPLDGNTMNSLRTNNPPPTPRNGNPVAPPRNGNTVAPPPNGNIVTSPRNGNTVAPPPNGNTVTPPRNGNTVAPPPNGNTVAPPRNEMPATSPRRENTAEPPRNGNTVAPPRTDISPTPPRRENTAAPPRNDTPPTPPRRENTAAPPRNDAPPTPPRRENTVAPPRNDAPPTPPRRENTAAPPRNDAPPARNVEDRRVEERKGEAPNNERKPNPKATKK